MKQKDPPPSWVRDLGRFGVITWNLVIYTLVGFSGGYFAWKKLWIPQVLIVIPTLLGMVLGFIQIFRLFQKDQE